ncbi:MAG: flavodoxin family protein [Methanomassiliicoccales archaeon]
MKVLGIVGSPRKNGNTESIVQAVLDAAKEKGHATEKFNLNELNFAGCQACMYCKSHDRCKLEDDLVKVMDAVRDADAIVFGAPIYMGQLNGQFKLFEDRLYMFLGTDFKVSLKPGKKAIVVTSQGNPDPKMFEGTAHSLANMLKMFGLQVIDAIQMTGGNSPGAIMDRKDLLDIAKNAGNKL